MGIRSISLTVCLSSDVSLLIFCWVFCMSTGESYWDHRFCTGISPSKSICCVWLSESDACIFMINMSSCWMVPFITMQSPFIFSVFNMKCFIWNQESCSLCFHLPDVSSVSSPSGSFHLCFWWQHIMALWVFMHSVNPSLAREFTLFTFGLLLIDKNQYLPCCNMHIWCNHPFFMEYVEYSAALCLLPWLCFSVSPGM